MKKVLLLLAFLCFFLSIYLAFTTFEQEFTGIYMILSMILGIIFLNIYDKIESSKELFKVGEKVFVFHNEKTISTIIDAILPSNKYVYTYKGKEYIVTKEFIHKFK